MKQTAMDSAPGVSSFVTASSQRTTPGGNVEAAGESAETQAAPGPKRIWGNLLYLVQQRGGSRSSQYFKAVCVVTGVTIAGHFLCPLIGVHATGLIYLLAVVLLALFVERGPTLLAASMSALAWDYFFLPPVFAIWMQDFEDTMLLVTYFVVTLVLGQLTTRIRMQQEAERLREERATALYLLARELNTADGHDQMLQKAVRQTKRAFQARVAVLLEGPAPRKLLKLHPASGLDVSGVDERAANFAFEQRQPAGKFTIHHPFADGFYLPLTTGDHTMGVLGFGFSEPAPPGVQQKEMLNAFAQQIATALDRHRLNEISEKARLLVESERLGKTLLNSMSHEIRTPLAAIKSATGNLVAFQETALSQPQQDMIAEIQEATERLNRLVGNVLEISRLESGHIKPRLHWCDVRDLVHVAVKETKKELAAYNLTVDLAPDLPLARMDFVLMQHALTNLLSNAAFHTPPGTAVKISAWSDEEALFFTVADRGPGIPADLISRIFDKFYRMPAARTGGTGLGLSLVKGFVEAQGGETKAENLDGGGAIFTIRLHLHRADYPAPTIA